MSEYGTLEEVKKSIKTVERKIKRFLKQFRLIFLFVMLYVFAGTLFYTNVENWQWLDAMYFSVISLTTVGYGHLYPVTAAGKIFTMFYLIFGIGIFGAFISNILHSRVAKKALNTYERHIEHEVEKVVEKLDEANEARETKGASQ